MATSASFQNQHKKEENQVSFALPQLYSGIRTSGGTKGLAPMTAAASAEGVCLPDGDAELEDEEDEDDAVADLKKEL